MARLKAFLPLMKQANDELALRVQQDPNFGGFEIIDTEDPGAEPEFDGSEDEESYEQDVEESNSTQSKVIQMVRRPNSANEFYRTQPAVPRLTP